MFSRFMEMTSSALACPYQHLDHTYSPPPFDAAQHLPLARRERCPLLSPAGGPRSPNPDDSKGSLEAGMLYMSILGNHQRSVLHSSTTTPRGTREVSHSKILPRRSNAAKSDLYECSLGLRPTTVVSSRTAHEAS